MSRRSLLRVLLVCAAVALGLIAAPLSEAAAATLSGTVTGQLPGHGSESVIGATITVTPSEGGEEVASTMTGGEGQYSLEVPTGLFDVRVAPKGGSPFEATTIQKVEVVGSRTLDVLLAEKLPLHLFGTLLGSDGEALPEVEVTLAGATIATTTTDGAGHYSFTVMPGEYRLGASQSGGANAPSAWTLETEPFALFEDQERDLQLPTATSRLVVKVTNDRGEPISGASVTPPEYVTTVESDGLPITFTSGVGSPGRTDEAGLTSFREFDNSVPTGRGSVAPPSGAEYSSADFLPPPMEGVEREVSVALPAQTASPIFLAGNILGPFGGEFSVSRISLIGKNGTSNDTSGASHFNYRVDSGTYRLTASGAGSFISPSSWSFETSSFAITESEPFLWQLPLAKSFLSVEVIGPKGEPVPGAIVTPPSYSKSSASGGLETTYTSTAPAVSTDETGRATFREFNGSAPAAEGEVSPPPGSGFAGVSFEAPPLNGAATVVVRLLHEGKEEEPGGKEPPHLDTLSIEPSEIDTSTTKVPVTLVAHITDESGLTFGRASFRSPDGEELISSSDFERVSGSETDGIYEALVTFPQGSEPGGWLIGTIELADHAGNELSLGPEQLAERGFPYEVTVLAPEVSPPVVTGISPTSGPETGGTEVVISGSGFEGATAVNFGGSKAEFEIESPETIVAYAPPGTGNVGVVVTTPAGTSDEVNYAYTPSAAVTLTSSPNPSVHGQKVTFTAMVSPGGEGGPTPIGTVSFVEGTSTLGVANLSKGVAKLSTTALGAGEHPVVAEYSGDSHYGESRSSTLTQVVSKATTEVALTSSLDPSPFGASATLKAHLAAVAPGAGTPAGTVTFLEGETVIDTVQLSGGNASLPLKAPAPGTHTITASYSGDANDKPSEAGPFTQTVTKASTELSLTSTLNPAPFGSSATLKATVKAVAPGGGTPAGTVTFREGETVLATIPLTSGSAKYALKTTAPGEYAITATYSGEADYEGSSDSLDQAIVPASTELALTSSKNPAPHGSSGTLKATVKAVAPGAGTPSGTVTFREGETVLAIVPLSGGAATYPLKALAVGEHEITATYSGSSGYEASAASIGQVITP